MRSQLQTAIVHKEEQKIFEQGVNAQKSHEADNDDQTLSIKSQSIYSQNQVKEAQKIENNDKLDEGQQFEYINEKIEEWPSWVVEEKSKKQLQKNEDISYQVIIQSQYTKKKQNINHFQSMPMKKDESKNQNSGEEKKIETEQNKKQRQPKARLGRSAIRFLRLQQERKMRKKQLELKKLNEAKQTESKIGTNQTVNL